jgi:type II secretory pathway pseudopilin PulG
MVVIVIIAILTSLLIIGIKVLATNAKRQQTQMALSTCQGMFAEYDVVTRAKYGSSTEACPGVVAADAGGTVTGYGDRTGTAVMFTRDVMYSLKMLPANASALTKLPATQLMTMPASTATATTWTSGTAYNLFDRVTYATVAGGVTPTYVCVQAVPSGATNASPLNPSYWIPAPADAVANTVPVVLDGWGNPIIFVPGGTLGTGAALSTASGTIGNVIANSGAMRSGTGAAAISTQAKSPDGRPFFASAGPDGDFSNGDDNLYSYEK